MLAQTLRVLFYVICSYLPGVIFGVLITCLGCSKSQKNLLPSSGFAFNQQDMNDLAAVLKIVKQIEKSSEVK